ncbi:MAG TPA: biopolymer transporter ExbD [Sphingobium sp.]
MLLAMIATGGSTACHGREHDPIEVTIDCDPEKGPNSVTIDGQRIDWSSDDATMAGISKAIGHVNRPVRIKASTETPYRCIGGVIFSLQRAGVSKIDFVTTPASSTEPHQ